MARIRSIHPGLMTDEAYMELTVEQPLAIALYLGLLMESDDFGLFEWKPMTIKARVLPALAAGVGPLLEALIDKRFIRQFSIEGRSYGAIRNFCKFQRPKKPKAWHPRTGEVDTYVGQGEKQFPTGSEPDDDHDDTGSENRPQMEDGGGSSRRKKETSLSEANPQVSEKERERNYSLFASEYPPDGLKLPDEARRELDARLDEGVPIAEIVAGARAYRELCVKDGRKGRYVKAAHSWLRGGGWKEHTSGPTPSEIAVTSDGRVLVLRTDRRWPALERMDIEQRGGKPGPATKSTAKGWYFPASWIEKLTEDVSA